MSRAMRRMALAALLGLGVLASAGLVACDSEEAAKEAPATVEQVEATATAAPSRAAADDRPWSFHGQRGITAVFVPTDLALYRSLLPAAFDMPESPLIAVTVVNYYDVTLPLTPYSEGYVVMQCRYQGRTGWYVLTMPVDDETANMGGRALGFPKYVADEIALTETADAWRGRVTHESRNVMDVVFTADPEAEPVESNSDDAGVNIFLLMPPAEGPEVNEVHIDIYGGRRTLTTAGSAVVQADPGEAWAGLLPSDGAALSATFEEMTGGWVLTSNLP